MVNVNVKMTLSNMNTTTIALTSIATITVVTTLYIFGFIFIHGSAPGTSKLDKFIDDTCCKDDGLLKTVLTFGYFKASYRRFKRYYYHLLFNKNLNATLGKKAPDCTIYSINGEKLSLLSDYINKMPTGIPLILNMGSYTWPPWSCNACHVLELSKNYCEGTTAVAKLLNIYIEEAHSKDEWYLPESVDKPIINAHKNLNDRIIAAKKFVDEKKFHLNVVVDGYDDNMTVTDIYAAWPERIYIIIDGVIVYKGGIGPFGYNLPEVQQFLFDRYGARGNVITY